MSYFTSTHTKWLIRTNELLKTVDGKEVEVWELQHQENDEAVLSEWAQHFRNHYCSDGKIDILRRGTGYSRSEYLNQVKFPDPENTLGRGVRSGDFGEILVADFLEYLLGYWVPRTRHDDKRNRNSSPLGSDVLGFSFVSKDEISDKDELAIFEVKVNFSKQKKASHLQTAVKDSIKDDVRKGESLNAVKQRLLERGEEVGAYKVARFQNKADQPYDAVYGAVGLFDNTTFDNTVESSTDTSSHPHSDSLMLVVIKGKQMLELVRELYKRAADEA